MQRRSLIHHSALAGLAGLAGAASAPAVLAQTPARASASVKWRMSTSWPKSLDTMYGSAEHLCKRVAELTEGKFQIQCFAGGEIVPPAQNMEAVSSGTIECNHVLASAFIGKNTAVAFDTGLPFGLNARQHNAWMQFGGGMELLREMYRKQGIVNLVCGNVGVQMGGWYRKPIKRVEDLRGLKMRIGGIGGMVMSKLGAVPQQIPAADIYPSLEKGTIDAAEWIGPYDDAKLGLQKVAQYYYAPGWWEGSASITAMVNAKAWDALPPAYKAAFECAANEQTVKMLADYDFRNPEALKRLVGQGARLSYFPRPVMDAAFKASGELFDELAAANPDFKALLPGWLKFRRDQASWFRVAEAELDNYTFARVTQ
ncbi:Extracytoplasmic solute receptor protein yiaO [Delftia tsuruhatensis]|uniref:TRAP transporter substrate-binding protein n=1 Tax=Delftia tsuruhatensis TaxID=180282 RepID=UPI001E761665|nr:TRAP transporter substrate-binding protein [Delftia tsuruhatensis]CAB5713174.1 Extracytoplasmic solute receptor protein yiaO [Delftia tsuruhatensis]CAC9691940.1 Extracytoplasmic solute receptor protein yiaO [Delftia tsuruhatensis]